MKIYRLLAPLALTGLCSCATYIVFTSGAPTNMRLSEARSVATQALLHAGISTHETGQRRHSISSVSFTPRKLIISTAQGAALVRRMTELDQVEAILSAQRARIRLRFEQDKGVLSNRDIVLSFAKTNRQEISRIAGSLVVLKQAAADRSSSAREVRFEEAVISYLSAKTKPQLPEEARRLKERALAAAQAKNFRHAAELYELALEIAPWWPDGHLNRALALAQNKEFADAILEMRRYLLLVPDAPGALEKLGAWENKLNQ